VADSLSRRTARPLQSNAKRHKRRVRHTTSGDVFLAFKPATAIVRVMTDTDISAPATSFLAGLGRALGYSVQADGERLTVAFEPWSLEHADPYEVPCLRLMFRQDGDRVVLESFTISDDGEERRVDLEAARDALQTWMDCMAG